MLKLIQREKNVEPPMQQLPTGVLLAATYGKTAQEAQGVIIKGQWGVRYPVIHHNRVVGIVSLYNADQWYHPAMNRMGFRAVDGTWTLVPDGEFSFGYAVLDNA